MSPAIIIITGLSYLALLFLAAYFIERRAVRGKSILSNPWVYSLSLAVYCTAWTYYGSVGKAVNDGLLFITIYLGPVIIMPLWWIVVRKMIRICNIERISTLADFISSRYGKSVFLSVLVSVLAVVGIIPYISIQLKSISSSFNILAYGVADVPYKDILSDSAFYLTLILAVFVILFAFRTVDTTDKHEGMVGAIALESLIKLLAFMAVGVYVTFYMFDGFADVFAQASPEQLENFLSLNSKGDYEWFFLILLSMSAVMLLPRQFQVAVAENTDESHIKTASWVFPAYLLIINLFVIPIALGGQINLGSSMDPDSYVLGLPLSEGKESLALLTFFGGFSASTSMIIVSTISLSIMVSNNIVVPLTLKNIENKRMLNRFPLETRRVAVFIILLLAYGYFKFVSDRFSIVSIGLISFAAMLQFAPSVFGALFWKDANKKGAVAGLIAGFTVWFYTLAVPTIVDTGLLSMELLNEGPFGIRFLRPNALLGLSMDPVSHGTFWSILVNLLFFCAFSLFFSQSAKERNLAEYYVDIYEYTNPIEERLIWKGQLVYRDLIDVCEKLLGKIRTKQNIEEYERHFGPVINLENEVEPRFVSYMERLISGVVGAASARMIISSVSHEEEIELSDVVKILKETSEITRLNRALKMNSAELEARTHQLEKANARLRDLDSEKDDFISTVTHELRTPLTSIKAFVEILHDHQEIGEEDRAKFLETIIGETDRMTRLINQVLDLEKFQSGSLKLNTAPIQIKEVLQDAITSLRHLFSEKQVRVVKDFADESVEILGDEDRLKQVFINLLSNAIKFVPDKDGQVTIKLTKDVDQVEIVCSDNGKGIAKEDLERVFDKFYQVRDQARKKPKGTGLGLSITKKIVELHRGTIRVESKQNEGATFYVKLPINVKEEVYENA